MPPRERVPAPAATPGGQQTGAPAPQSGAIALWGAATLATLADYEQPATILHQLPDAVGHTETQSVEAFEPVPDSPTNTSSDQHHQAHPQALSSKLQAAKTQHPWHEGTASQAIHRAPQLQPQPQPGTAHMHLIGEVTGALGLGSEPLYCTWQLVYDTELWSVLRGTDKGRTHASSPLQGEDGGLSGVVWECPIDVLLATRSLQHWPRIVFKVFHRSLWLGRDAFVGYGLLGLPITPGTHHLSCPVWCATEGRPSMRSELTKLFTGLHPQLVQESFITDLEQRYEQGQHLHTLGCSSSSSGCTPDVVPAGYALERTGGAGGVAPGRAGRPFCPSFSAAGSGGTAPAGVAGVAGAGGRLSLRLHVLTRGMEQLSRWRGDGAESIGRCLERLHSSVDKLRRRGQPGGRDGLSEVAEGSEADEAEVAEESKGVQLVRAGRADRLAAAQRQVLGRDSDRKKPRDQQQMDDEQQQHQQAGGARSLLSYTGGTRFSTSSTRAAGGGRLLGSTARSRSSSSSSTRPLQPRLGAGSTSTSSSTGTTLMTLRSPQRDGAAGTTVGSRSAWGTQQGAAGGDSMQAPGIWRATAGGLSSHQEPLQEGRGGAPSPVRSIPISGYSGLPARLAGSLGGQDPDGNGSRSRSSSSGGGKLLSQGGTRGEPLLPAEDEHS